MKKLLTALLLATLVVVARGGVLSWLEGDDRLQADQPQQSQTDVSAILRAVEEVGKNFLELAGRRSSWLQRYDTLANDTSRNSVLITELLGISRIAMPIIWNTFASNVQMRRFQNLARGGSESYIPPTTLPTPHPLRSLATQLTDQEDFTVEVVLKLNEEANVGLRIVYEQEEEEEFDWDGDDMFMAVHLLWHFRYGPDKELVFMSREAGEFLGQYYVRGERWPNPVVGEKFAFVIAKKGSCVQIYVQKGADMYYQIPNMNVPYQYCPEPRSHSMEGRKLRVVINEDDPGTGQLQVYGITWYPGTVL